MRFRPLDALALVGGLFLFALVSPAVAGAPSVSVWVGAYNGSALQQFSVTGTALNTATSTTYLSQVAGLASDGSGNLYVSSAGGGSNGVPAVIEYTPKTATFSVYGSLPSPDQYDWAPGASVFGPNGSLYVAGQESTSVYVFSGAGSPSQTLTVPSAAYSSSAYPFFAGGMAFDSSGTLYIGDIGGFLAGLGASQYNTNQGLIVEVTNPTTSPTYSTFVAPGGSLGSPSGLLWHGGTLYVADLVNNVVQEYNSSGTLTGSITMPSPASQQSGDTTYIPTNSPSSLVPDSSGLGFLVALNGPSQTHPSGSVLDYSWSGSLLNTILPSSSGYVPTGIAVVPEPSSWLLVATAGGILGIIGVRKRRQVRAAG